MNYAALEHEPAQVRDHSEAWSKLWPLQDVNGDVHARVLEFCARKRITFDALLRLEPRLHIGPGGAVELAYAGTNGNGAITAVKFRPLSGTSADCRALSPSVWLRPIIVGPRDSQDWLIAEGETDGARLVGLAPPGATVLVLPVGGGTFKREWADLIPRGATVYLCHDADQAGDEGAEAAVRILGGKTVRVRPPVEAGDWCDWDGDTAGFASFVAAALNDELPFSLSLTDFVELERPRVEPLLLEQDGQTVIAARSLTLLGALGGAGKTTWFVDLALHLAAGVDYPPFKVPCPVSVLLIENEGPEQEFADKLGGRLAAFPHELKARIGVHSLDWGGFSLARSELLERLKQDIADHEYDLVFGDPLDSLGIEGVGSPEDTRKFLELMKQAGLNKTAAFWLNCHPRKEKTREALDEISGAWGGKPDAVLLLDQLLGDRTQIRFPKLRWAKRGTRPTILLDFDPDTEAFTYLGDEAEDGERNYLLELAELLRDGVWRTVKEASAPKDKGGIGANAETVAETFAEHPSWFVSRSGPAAKEVGRHASATVWQLHDEARDA